MNKNQKSKDHFSPDFKLFTFYFDFCIGPYTVDQSLTRAESDGQTKSCHVVGYTQYSSFKVQVQVCM